MRRKFVGVGLVLAVSAAGLVLTTAGAAKPEQEAFKAAWIYVGPHNDGGWSQAHDAGRLKVQKALGSKVVTTYKENVPEGPQVAQVIESLIRDGNKMIFATSFGFQTAMVAAAKKHPDVYFEMATGTATSKNLAEYFGASEDAIYLSGHGRGSSDEEGHDRIRRPVRDPRGDPSRERVRPWRPGDSSEREGAARVDELVVRPEEGAPGG